MKVKEVIDKCQALLDVESAKEDLLRCFNIIENELALDYLPLYTTHKCNSAVIKFDELEYNPVRIVSCNCDYKVYTDCIKSKDNITSIQYAYTPNTKNIHDECSYNEAVMNCLVYGTISEYLLTKMFYEESMRWTKKYKKEIETLML